jgi:hypothetical protein
MTLTNNLNFLKLLLLQLTLTFLISSQAFSQQRKDEEMPKVVNQIKSITNLKGWAKDDIGKWYEFNTAFNSIKTREQILKIELAKVSYEDKQYLCVAGFVKSFYIKANVKHIEYHASFWLIDTTKMQDLPDTDTTVHTRLFQNFIVSSVVGGYFRPVIWSDILIQMKKCFIGTFPNDYDTSFQARREERERYNLPAIPNIDPSFDPFESFFIKYRYDKNKVQFYIGTLRDSYLSNTGDFSFKDAFLFIDCYDNDENRNLNCRYFEVPKNTFDNCFQSIIK